MNGRWHGPTRFVGASLVASLFRSGVAFSAEPSGSTEPRAVPPPNDTSYLQYGVAFAGEVVADPGPMCSDAKGLSPSIPCILGSGGGVVIRAGYRAASPWYFGGAYELSKQDPSKLYRLATLQQLRGEARYYLTTGLATQPYASVGAGFAGYGNEWGIDTFGASGHLAIATETQITRTTVFGLSIGYRAIWFKAFEDSSRTARPDGVAQLFGFDLLLEARDPL